MSRRSSTCLRRRWSRMITIPMMLTRMDRHPAAMAKATGAMALQPAAQARGTRITGGASRCQPPPRALRHHPWHHRAGPLRGPRRWRRRAARPRGLPLRAHGARHRRQRMARGGAPASQRRPHVLPPLLPDASLETHPWRQGPRYPPGSQRPQRALRRSHQVGNHQPRTRRMPACLWLIPRMVRGTIVRTFPGSICPPGVRRQTMRGTATTGPLTYVLVRSCDPSRGGVEMRCGARPAFMLASLAATRRVHVHGGGSLARSQSPHAHTHTRTHTHTHTCQPSCLA